MKPWRIPRWLVVGYFLLFGLGVGLLQLWKGQTRGLLGMAVLWAIAAFANYMFDRAERAFAAAVARTRTVLGHASDTAFDAPGVPVQEKYDPTFSRAVLGARGTAPWPYQGTGLTAEGAREGVDWQFASYVTPTRNAPMYHVSSYVRVDLLGAELPFRIVHQTALGRLAGKLDQRALRGRPASSAWAAEGPRGTLVGGRSLRGRVFCPPAGARPRRWTGATRWSTYPPHRVMAILRGAGVERLGIVTDPATSQ